MQTVESTLQSSHEQHSQPSVCDGLRQARSELAGEAGSDKLRQRMSLLDPLHNCGTQLINVSDSGFAFDFGSLSIADELAFDALGVPAAALEAALKEQIDNEGYLFELSVANERLRISKYGRGVSATFDVVGHQPDREAPVYPTLIKDQIVDRLLQSPAYAAISELVQRLPKTGVLEGAQTTRSFDPDKDRLGTYSLLHQMGLIKDGITSQVVAGTDSWTDLLLAESRYRVEIIDDETLCHIVKSDEGYDCRATIDKRTGSMSLGFSADMGYFYSEHSGTAGIDSVPFVETVSFREMSGLLESAGLTYSRTISDEMLRLGNIDRYGSVYTQISREIAKWICTPERMRLSNLFSCLDADPDDSSEDIDEFISDRLEGIDESGTSEPTRIVLGQIKSCIARRLAGSGANLTSDLTVTKDKIQVRAGACSDVMAYYLEAPSITTKTCLRETLIDGVTMLEKSHGKETFMLEAPVMFNGVEIPKGSLMKQGEDGGWAFLRLTPFTFDNMADRQVFGSELAISTVVNKGVLGAVTLERLVNMIPTKDRLTTQ